MHFDIKSYGQEYQNCEQQRSSRFLHTNDIFEGIKKRNKDIQNYCGMVSLCCINVLANSFEYLVLVYYLHIPSQSM